MSGIAPDLLAINGQREVAMRTIGDIDALRNSEPFNRYWVARMNQRHDKLAIDFKYKKVTHEEREVLRLLVLEYEELAKLMSEDEALARALLERGQPTAAVLPGSAGNG